MRADIFLAVMFFVILLLVLVLGPGWILKLLSAIALAALLIIVAGLLIITFDSLKERKK